MPSVNISSASVGRAGQELISLMKLGNELVEQGSTYIVEQVGQTFFIPRFNVDDNALQTRSETPDAPSDSMNYDERALTPEFMMFYDTFNPNNFQEVWEQFYPNGMLVDTIDNPEVQAAILREVMKSVGKQLGRLVWIGDTTAGGGSPLRFFDGYVKIATDDVLTIKVTPAGDINENNIISILEDVEAAIPASIWKDNQVVFHLSTVDARKYLAAARALDFKGSNITDAEQMRFAGRQIRHYEGMQENSILVAKATADNTSNLWSGVWVSDDSENVKIGRHRPESELFFAKVLFKWGVEFANAEEVVIYNPS